MDIIVETLNGITRFVMRHNIREQLTKMNILTALLNYNFRIGMLIGKNTFEALIPKGCLLQVGREIE